jgi:hypothetical protein
MLRPVRSGRRQVATVVDVVLSASLRSVLGVDVAHRGTRRFLPWIALRAGRDDLRLTSAATLDRPTGLALLFSRGVRLSQTCHRATLVVDRLGEIRPQ